MSNEAAGGERVLALLSLFSGDRDELRVSTIATALRVHKSTASRLASTLERHEFLVRRGGLRDGYRLGPAVARLGVIALGGRGWAEVARPALEALATATGEAAVLSVAAGADALPVLQETAPRLVGATSWVGRHTPLHATSDGKALLAFGAAALPPEARLERVAPGTITDRARLERELEAARRAGYACAVGEAEEGLNGVAVPVFDAEGTCVAAVSVSGPAYRVVPDALPGLAARCDEAVAEIRERLGWTRETMEVA